MGTMSKDFPVVLQCVEDVEDRLQQVVKSMMAMQTADLWPGSAALDNAITTSLHFLGQHLHMLSDQILLFQSAKNKPVTDEEITHNIEDVLSGWNHEVNPPSLLAIVLISLDYLGVKPKPDEFNILAVAAILGEIENNQPYHNNMHFRKVLSQLVRLIKTNNVIFEGTYRVLNTKDICLLLAAACIHDLGHDGKGNTVKGVHTPGRTEQNSIDLAKPYLELAGCENEELQALCIMLLTTDVSPLKDPTSPMKQMKAAYRAHYVEKKSTIDKLNLSDDLKILEEDKRLTALCLLLHEADIATSAGISYLITQNETLLLMQEFGKDEARPSQITEFIKLVCGRTFLSDAGQKLFAANMARIYTLAEDEVKNGDTPFSLKDIAQSGVDYAASNGKSLSDDKNTTLN